MGLQDISCHAEMLFPYLAGPLNLSQYSGLWGGKWCNSLYDPPAVAGAPPKPDCPVINGTAIPQMKAIVLPPIVTLASGSTGINIVSNNLTTPLEIKVIRLSCCSCTVPQASTNRMSCKRPPSEAPYMVDLVNAFNFLSLSTCLPSLQWV